MIDYLDKLRDNNDSSSKSVEIRNYFNRRLIHRDVKEDFNTLYEKFYKCLICNDVIYDPVHCSECQLIFCNSCISNPDLKRINFLCNHTKLSKVLPDHEKLKFEKIKVNCFFNCSNQTLNLFNYHSHLKSCKEKFDLSNMKSTNKDITTNQKDSLEVGKVSAVSYDDKFVKLIENNFNTKINKLNEILQNKDKLIQSLQINIIETDKAAKTQNHIMDQLKSNFIELELKTQKTYIELLDLKYKLQNRIEAYEIMKKKKDEDNENFIRERSDLNKKSENQNKLREDLEKRCKKLVEEKNNILMFNSSAQNLSESEIKFRELINNIIDPDLSILSLNNNNLEDIHIKYLSQCNFLKGLTSLDLQNNSLLTLEGFKTLEQCGFIHTLTEFKLKWTIKGLEGLQNLKDCIFLKKLTE